MEPQTQKLYCYVDETGQDTLGELFIVAVFVTAERRDELAGKLETIEATSGKGRVKWIRSRPAARLAYMKSVLASPGFRQTLCYSVYRATKSYMALTVLSTARAILSISPPPSQTTVYVDGLPKSRLRWFATELRHLSIRNGKVVGVRREESDVFIRLADAVAGFVRGAMSGQQPEMAELFARGRSEGFLKEI